MTVPRIQVAKEVTGRAYSTSYAMQADGTYRLKVHTYKLILHEDVNTRRTYGPCSGYKPSIPAGGKCARIDSQHEDVNI